MRTFLIIWFGQFVSRIGTAVTRFGLLIWAYQHGGSATAVAMLGFFAFVPMILVSPIAGVWVDRLDRRKIMLLADGGAGLITLGLLLLFTSGQLQLWHLFVAQVLTGVFEAFQGPAYTALTTQLLPKEQYTRASGLRAMAGEGANIIAPMIAGFLLVWIDISGVMIIDLFTLLVALGTLLIVTAPTLVISSKVQGQSDNKQFWPELQVGFDYIRSERGLLGLLLIFGGMNFIDGLAWLSIFPVMILARSGGNEIALASVEAAFGLGGVIGGLCVSVWGGPKRHIHAALGGGALSFLLGGLLLGVGQSLPVWIFACFVAMFFVPFIGSGYQAIWQTKVAPEILGRVLALQSMVHQAAIAMGILLGGIMADIWFEPAMMPGEPLTPLFGKLVGTGPGAGMALMFVVTAVLGCAMSLAGYLFTSIRQVEDELPNPTQPLSVSIRQVV